MAHELQLKNKKYRNLVKAGLGLKYTKEGLEEFCDRLVKQQHSDILDRVKHKQNLVTVYCGQCDIQTLLPDHGRTKLRRCLLGQPSCNCLHPQGKSLCPNRVCGTIYDVIVQLHARTPPCPNWKNANMKLLCTEPWAVAVRFINTSGYESKLNVSEFDCSGLLHLLDKNLEFRDHLNCTTDGTDLLLKVLQHRNQIYHSHDYELEGQDAATMIDDMIALLQDGKELLYMDESKAAVEKLKDLKKEDFVITITNEVEIRRAIDADRKSLEEDAKKLKDELAETGREVKYQVVSDLEQKELDIKDTISKAVTKGKLDVIEKGKDSRKELVNTGTELKRSLEKDITDAVSKGKSNIIQTGKGVSGDIASTGTKLKGDLENVLSDAVTKGKMDIIQTGKDVAEELQKTGTRLKDDLVQKHVCLENTTAVYGTSGNTDCLIAQPMEEAEQGNESGLVNQDVFVDSKSSDQQSVESSPMSGAVETDEIVIVGVGCRFPGADNVEQFWRVLRDGENHVKEVPKNRWDVDAFYDPDRSVPGKTYVRQAGFLKSIEEWDHRFFGISDTEAELIDPQQRIVLDCVHMAFEDGGITKRDISGSRTGVYIGSMTDDYKGSVIDDTSISSAYAVTGTHNSIISARVSYVYNLEGPAMTVDTACSSSLVAIDVASQALLTGRCSMAICGGVNVLMNPQLFVALSKAGMLSPSGQCKAFTNEADGYARGEGCGIVLLKLLRHAIKDGNKIWGTIKTATNQDGRIATPITAPSRLQQERLIEEIYTRNEFDKARIKVIEAHGTGTPIGDPAEVGALSAHFGTKANAPDQVYIGSVKTNIGHLEAAAGLAGLIKVLLMLKNEVIVPSLWYTKKNENPKLKLSRHGFVVPTDCVPWKRSETHVRSACVNSFGFGGTNAHGIVEESKLPAQRIFEVADEGTPLPFFFAISAFDKTSLYENVEHFKEALKSRAYDMRALSYTSTCRRDHRPKRKAVYGKTQDDIIAAYSAFLECNESPIIPSRKKTIVFVFCGVGNVWNGMCSLLMKLEHFRKTLAAVDEYLQPLTGWKISDKFIYSADLSSDPMIAHVAIFSCQIGLAALWEHLDIRPDTIVGQSVGEIAAAYVGGHLDLKTAVQVIFYRSKFLSAVKKGRMAVIRNVDIAVVEQYCKSYDSVTVAVYLSPISCTVSGSDHEVEKLKKDILDKKANANVIDLEVSCAYHSSQVEDVAKHLANELKGISHCDGKVKIISTVTGKTETSSVFGSPSYWERNVRMPVLFSSAIKLLESNAGQNIFIELGPRPVLKAHIRDIFTEWKNYITVPSLQKEKEISTLSGSICKLYELGLNINWEGLFRNPCQPTDIPVYQFRKYRQLYQSSAAIKRNNGIDGTNADRMFIKQLPYKENGIHFKVEIDEKSTPFVFHHIVRDSVILPGAVYADIGFEIGTGVLKLPKEDIAISLEFLRPVKPQKIKTTLYISVAEQKDELLFHAKLNQVTMCKGWVRPAAPAAHLCTDRVDAENLKLTVSNPDSRIMLIDEMYGNLESVGFKYQSYFKLMRSCTTNGSESLTEIEVPDALLKDVSTATIHYCVLDSMMQSSVNTTTDEILSTIRDENIAFLPVAIGNLRVFRKAERRMYIFTKRISTTILDDVLQVHYNALLLNHRGDVAAYIENLKMFGKRNRALAPCDLNYKLTWHPYNKSTISDDSVATVQVLMLTNQCIEELEKHLDSSANITCVQKKANQSYLKYLATAFESSATTNKRKAPDTVLLLVGENSPDTAITKRIADGLHLSVKQNLMLLTELVKYMTNRSISCPLYIATQNTQPTFTANYSPTINLVGEELWGLVRSVIAESIHGDITLIDLQPSIKETKQTLFQFIYDTCHNIKQTKPEIVIHFNEVFGAQFTKIRRNEIIPKLRKETRVAKGTLAPQKVLAVGSQTRHHFVLTESSGIQEKQKRNHLNVRVKTVYTHSSCICPLTSSGANLDLNIWQEAPDDDQSLFGLEYTGIHISRRKHHKLSCLQPDTQSEGEVTEDLDEIICIHPKEMTTEMLVPKACTVKLKDISMYKPGLLLHTMLCWRLAEYIPLKSRVFIYSQRPAPEWGSILSAILRKRRKADVVDMYKEPDDNGALFDVLVSLERLEASVSMFGRCEKIICFEESITESVRMKISRSPNQTLQCLNAVKLLSERNVRKSLKHAVSWLQRYYKRFHESSSLNELTTDDKECNMPSQLLEVIKEGHLMLPSRNPIDKLFHKNAVYIVTGGLTGLGWEIVCLLAEMGAGEVAIISRREVSSAKCMEISQVEQASGCKIVSVQGDVTDLASVQTALKEVKRRSALQVRGVFHGAGVLKSTLLMNLDETKIDYVLKPKVLGTLNMHIATEELDLDFFVVPSSLSSVLGSPGQSSYGAANSFLDTFMEWRRRKGLAGQAINWGALGVGMATKPDIAEHLRKLGFSLLSVYEIRSCFQEALMKNCSSVVYTDINWDIYAKNTRRPKLDRTRLQMALLIEQEASLPTNEDEVHDIVLDIKALQMAGREVQMMALVQFILLVSSKVTGEDACQIKTSYTLAELSLDSMSSLAFRSMVYDKTGYQIEISVLFNQDRTLADISELIHDAVFNSKFTADGDESLKSIGLQQAK